MAEAAGPRKRSMVGWYDPRVLAHTAYQVGIANIFGRHSDTRLIEALAHGVPVGGELDYLDDGTLTAALRARRAV